ncbi:hypothetical protein PLICRDRAFT_178761 [Plicaturopsis crispa FD-325 SS-3]|nr:hypothetical protein PLICRDRAFT_178761 [Plicaturopsis crispa FD-325 SS-3]
MRLHICIYALAAALATAKPSILDDIASLEKSQSPLLHYPTQFTQGIVPKAIHSHNDYWREVPLLTALSYGVSSVEADVWLVDGDLLVGHELAALTKNRTFRSLYVDPLKKIIDGQNPKTPFTANQTSVNGVFDTSSGTSLQLLVDMKTDGNATLPVVLRQLASLRDAGYLTTYHTTNATLNASAITVVGTGNTPLAGIRALSPARDIFFDAPLDTLAATDIDASISPLASTDYSGAVGWSGIGDIGAAQAANVARLVGDAHARGIKARFWDTPGWPVGARDAVWKALAERGADWLNADDLEAASEF